MLIATALGVGFTVLLGAALMLVFLSNRSGRRCPDDRRSDKKERP